MFEMARFTDNARAIVHSAFRDFRATSDQNLLAALLRRKRGVGKHLLAEVGITACNFQADAVPIVREWLVSRAKEIARQRGVNYIGSEHLVIALAGADSLLLCRGSQRLELYCPI